MTVALSARLWLKPSPLFRRTRRPEQSETKDSTTADAAATDTNAAGASAADSMVADANAAGAGASDAVSRDDDAIAVALIWTVWGFLSSLGANFFLNRWLHDYVLLFQSIRLPSRWAMICYVGLAVLAGVGASRLACRASRLVARPRVAALVFAVGAAAKTS